MSWCWSKWGRFALARPLFEPFEPRGPVRTMWDVDGQWKHVLGPVWALTDRGAYPESDWQRASCADVDSGDVMVLCECGELRPERRPHGWRRARG